jgi:hypothetical protein
MLFTMAALTIRSVNVGAGALGLFVLLAIQACSSGAANESQSTQPQLRLLDPRDVVALYWDAALRGDGETIKRIVGLPGNSMLWDCAPKPSTSNELGKIARFERPDEATEVRLGEPVNNIELILLDAHLIKINRKRLVPDYEQAEYKSFGNEARILYRPKDSPNTTNSKVFFLLMQGDEWRIVDVTSESHLQFVRNKKFGEARECVKY